MNRSRSARLPISVALGVLAMVATSAAPPPPRGGTIYIDPGTAGGDAAAPSQTFVNAASEALGAKGFTILDDPGHAAYVAEMAVNQSDVGTAKAKVAAGRPAVSGTGISLPFSTGQTRLVALQRTRLDLRIHRRGERAILWRGAAVTVRSTGAANGSDERVAPALSEAALRLYPNQSTEVVGVP